MLYEVITKAEAGLVEVEHRRSGAGRRRPVGRDLVGAAEGHGEIGRLEIADSYNFV